MQSQGTTMIYEWGRRVEPHKFPGETKSQTEYRYSSI